MSKKLQLNIDLVEQYTHELLENNIITTTKLRTRALTNHSMHVLIKLYAMEHYRPYTFTRFNCNDYKFDYYYITNYGMEWFKLRFNSYDRGFMISIFPAYARSFKKGLPIEKACSNICGNGTTGAIDRRMHPCTLVHTKGRIKTETVYKDIDEARRDILDLLRYNDISEFKLFYMFYDNKEHRWKRKQTTLIRGMK